MERLFKTNLLIGERSGRRYGFQWSGPPACWPLETCELPAKAACMIWLPKTNFHRYFRSPLTLLSRAEISREQENRPMMHESPPRPELRCGSGRGLGWYICIVLSAATGLFTDKSRKSGSSWSKPLAFSIGYKGGRNLTSRRLCRLVILEHITCSRGDNCRIDSHSVSFRTKSG